MQTGARNELMLFHCTSQREDKNSTKSRNPYGVCIMTSRTMQCSDSGDGRQFHYVAILGFQSTWMLVGQLVRSCLNSSVTFNKSNSKVFWSEHIHRYNVTCRGKSFQCKYAHTDLDFLIQCKYAHTGLDFLIQCKYAHTDLDFLILLQICSHWSGLPHSVQICSHWSRLPHSVQICSHWSRLIHSV